MARQFVASSSQALYAHSAPVTDYPFTLACWAYLNDLPSVWSDRYLLALTDKDDDYDRDGLGFYSAGAGSSYLTAISSTNWDAHSRSPGAGMGVSAGEWFHAAAVFASGSSRIAAKNGVLGTEATAAMSPNARDAVGIVCLPRASELGFGSYCDAAIAEVGIWNVALTEVELAQLALGVSPLLVRPGALAFYLPLVRDEDRDLVAGLSLTAANSPTVVEHPRVVYGWPWWLGAPAGGEPPGPEAEGTAHVSATSSVMATGAKGVSVTVAIEAVIEVTVTAAKASVDEVSLTAAVTVATLVIRNARAPPDLDLEAAGGASASAVAGRRVLVDVESTSETGSSATRTGSSTVEIVATGDVDVSGVGEEQATGTAHIELVGDVSIGGAGHRGASTAIGSDCASDAEGRGERVTAVNVEVVGSSGYTGQRGAESGIPIHAVGVTETSSSTSRMGSVSITAIFGVAATGGEQEAFSGEAHVVGTASLDVAGIRAALSRSDFVIEGGTDADGDAQRAASLVIDSPASVSSDWSSARGGTVTVVAHVGVSVSGPSKTRRTYIEVSVVRRTELTARVGKASGITVTVRGET